jgi:hypothetical protein
VAHWSRRAVIQNSTDGSSTNFYIFHQPLTRKQKMAEQTYELEFDGYWREPAVEGIPNKSGIYCVFSCVHNQAEKKVSLKKLIYIGESDDVRFRLANHEKLADWKKHVKQGEVLCFSFAPVPPTSRVRCEAAMIFKHEPPVNTEYSEAFPYDKTTISIAGKTTLLNTRFTVQSA